MSRFAGGRAGQPGRRRFLVGDLVGAPRPRLCAVRRADPGWGDHGVGVAELQRRAPARRSPRVGSAVVLYVLMLGGRRVTTRLATRRAASDGDRRDHGRGRCADARQLRHEFQNTIARDLPRSWSIRPKASRRSTVHKQLAAVKGGHTSALGKAVAGDQARSIRAGSSKRGGHRKRTSGTAAAPARSRARTGLRGYPAMVQHAGRQAAQALEPARQGGAGRLLDLQLHQLHPHAALPEGVVREVPFARARSRRRAHARVRRSSTSRATSRPRSTRTGSTTRWYRTTTSSTWNAYSNEYWPAEYFIDAHGNVRHAHFGEGEYAADERAIRSLLAEAGDGSVTRRAARREHRLR